MYAVLTTGGKQYRVEAGSMLVVEKLDGDPGSSVTFDRVLLVGDGEHVTVGTPTVAGATVSATVLGNERGRKIVVFKFKQKVKYRRRTGHRQDLTRLRIDAITADGKTIRAEEAKPAAPAVEVAAEEPKTEVKTPRRSRAKASAEPAAAPEASEPVKPARRSRAKAAAGAAPSDSAEKKAPAKPRASRAHKSASAKEG